MYSGAASSSSLGGSSSSAQGTMKSQWLKPFPPKQVFQALELSPCPLQELIYMKDGLLGDSRVQES